MHKRYVFITHFNAVIIRYFNDGLSEQEYLYAIYIFPAIHTHMHILHKQ